MKTQKTLISLFVFSLLFIPACKTKENTCDQPIDIEASVDAITNHLNQDFPGLGLDVFNGQIQHRPMSYGLVLLASSLELKNNNHAAAQVLHENSLNWVLSNQDIDNDGLIGFGLADSFDAFSDNSINPAHTEYTITNGLILLGLLEAYDLASTEAKSQILFLTESIVESYVNGPYSTDSGFIAYSSSENDRNYIVYNPAIFIAGTLQKFSKDFPNSELANSCSSLADSVIQLALSNKIESSNGAYYWLYGINQDRPNDLVHVCYIIEGFRMYKENEGAIDFPLDKIYRHLSDFKSENGYQEHPRQRQGIEDNKPRLWSLGMLLYTLRNSDDMESIDLIMKQLACYQNDQNLFKSAPDDPRVINRHLTHLLLGLYSNR